MFLIVGLALGWLQAVALGGLWWLAPLVLGIFGYFVPDILLYNQGIKRDEEMGKGLPDALDMLNLCVESGLSFQAALSQVAINQDGPVADEFALTLQEMQYGRSRGQALEALAVRARQPDIQRFVSAMLQVDKLGVPVATVLREQAKEMRAKRYARAREMAQKVPVKILMPLMLCFLPALFVIILGPAVYGIVQVFSNT
jgi:tight adherence protein C